jgi:hypothetical protein
MIRSGGVDGHADGCRAVDGQAQDGAAVAAGARIASGAPAVTIISRDRAGRRILHVAGPLTTVAGIL